MKKIVASVLAVAVFSASSITSYAALNLKNKHIAEGPAFFQLRQADRFERLLEAGVITQSAYEKIRAYLDEQPQKSDRTRRVGSLDSLLKAGVITQKEYGELKEAMAHPAARPEKREGACDANPFSRFVEDGIITRETADNIMEFIEANRPAKVKKDGTPDQMLADGVITQEEYDSIREASPGRVTAR